MNSQLIFQLARQHAAEIRQETATRQLAAADREPRDSVRRRAGWALINAGLKLTGPPGPQQYPRPRAAGL